MLTKKKEKTRHKNTRSKQTRKKQQQKTEHLNLTILNLEEKKMKKKNTVFRCRNEPLNIEDFNERETRDTVWVQNVFHIPFDATHDTN